MYYYNKSITTLHDLLNINTLNFANAEMQLKNSLPGWISHANSLTLKIVLQRYLSFVEKHVQKFADILNDEELVTSSPTERVMEAFICEVHDKLACCTDAPVKDACLLAAVQAINHFKISTYGTAAAFANELDMDAHAGIFREAEINEKQIDDRLSQLAQFEINVKAKAPVTLPG